MSVYTISPDLLRNIEKGEESYLRDILFIFTYGKNPFKVSNDKFGEVINSYLSVERNQEIIKTWLDLMSYKPSPFEYINVDLRNIDCEETKFLKLCKETKSQNKLIVYTTQNINKYTCENKIVFFESKAIYILDRDEATIELEHLSTSNSGDTFINSQVAIGSSQISKSQNK